MLIIEETGCVGRRVGWGMQESLYSFLNFAINLKVFRKEVLFKKLSL